MPPRRAFSLAFACAVWLATPVAADWPEEGVVLCTIGVCSPTTVRVCADGTGGAFAVWADTRNDVGGSGERDIYAQRILADGSLAPGWQVDGSPVTLAPGSQAFAIGDGTGRAYVTWDVTTTANGDIFVQRMTPDGAVNPGWPAGGAPVCLAPDEQGGACLTWDRFADPRVMVQHITGLGTVAPGWPAGGRQIPGEGAGPTASLELYDLSGRLVRSEEVGSRGAGAHTVRLGGGARLAAGVDTLRLRQGAQVARTRVVVIQ